MNAMRPLGVRIISGLSIPLAAVIALDGAQASPGNGSPSSPTSAVATEPVSPPSPELGELPPPATEMDLDESRYQEYAPVGYQLHFGMGPVFPDGTSDTNTQFDLVFARDHRLAWKQSFWGFGLQAVAELAAEDTRFAIGIPLRFGFLSGSRLPSHGLTRGTYGYVQLTPMISTRDRGDRSIGARASIGLTSPYLTRQAWSAKRRQFWHGDRFNPLMLILYPFQLITSPFNHFEVGYEIDSDDPGKISVMIGGGL